MRTLPIAFVCAILCFISYRLMGASPALAQVVEPPPGADIVFVVDQSGSMSRGPILDASDPRCGTPIQPDCPRGPATDPQALAIKALRSGLLPIFQRIVVREAERASSDLLPEEHTFGVVLFGGDIDDPTASAQVVVPLTRVEIQRDAEGNVSSNIDALLPISAVNLGETAFSRAFDTTCTLINCEVPPAPGRRRVVVLLTDGWPSRDSIAYSFENPAAYFATLRDRHRDLFTNAELWVLGLDQTDRFWSRNERFWTEIAPGRTRLIRAPADIAPAFGEIARAAVGEAIAPPRLCDGSDFQVAPYKSTLTLILEYPDVDSKARFLLPSGEQLSRDSATLAGYARSTLSETYVVENPTPGEWRCEIVGTSVTPQFRDIQGLFRVADVEIGRFGEVPSACRDFNLAVTYLDKDNNPIAELPDYPLTQRLQITIGDERIERMLVAADATRTRWRVDGVLTPSPGGGTYPLNLEVTLRDGTVVYSDTTQIIEIDPRLPCLSIVSPADGGTSSMHDRLSPVGLTLDVELSQAGTPTTPAGVFRESLDSIVKGRLEGPDGLLREMELKPVDSIPGRFRAVVDDLPSSLAAGGIYTFTASLSATTQDGERYELGPQQVRFTREPGVFWRVTQLALRVAALSAVLLLIGAVAYFVYFITPPYPSGTLVVQRRVTGDAAEFRQWEEVHRFGLSGACLLGFLRTRRVSLPVRSPSIQSAINIKRVRATHTRSGGQNGVRATLVPARKGSSQRELTFTKHAQHRDLGGDLRIVYENFAKRR